MLRSRGNFSDFVAEAGSISFEWNFQGKIVTGEKVTYSFNEARLFRITVKVIDSTNNSTSDFLEVEAKPPEINFASFGAGPGVFRSGQALCAPGQDCSDCGYDLDPDIQFPPCKFADIRGANRK